ncbi:PREDICTED: spexin-like [Gavialis gangeticus]|uniref:spexin-like n=1 Tax=Gavialis gangeticus TaxID=94835 RepID=UPI00092FC729|nr:PREDICTED: spexin-like [Gavialis gangeticus]
MIEGSDNRRAKMKTKAAVVCICAIFMVFLIVESWCAPKSKIIARNWGPQSMLYLKGRYGRRYASDDEHQYYKLDLEDLNAILKSYKSSTPVKFLNIRRKLTAQNMDINGSE